MNVILMGSPGAGKGAQSKVLAGWLHVPYVPTGDLMRAEAARSPLGLEVLRHMERGTLVPDSITIRMMLERLKRPDCQDGALLDGFPRSVPQAEALDEAWRACNKSVDIVLHMQASPEIVMQRMAHRWVCPRDNTVYNTVTKPPAVDNVCDLCGTPLVQRADDTPVAIQKRLMEYENETMPIVDYYARRDLVRTIDADRPIPEVTAALKQAILESRAGKPGADQGVSRP